MKKRKKETRKEKKVRKIEETKGKKERKKEQVKAFPVSGGEAWQFPLFHLEEEISDQFLRDQVKYGKRGWIFSGQAQSLRHEIKGFAGALTLRSLTEKSFLDLICLMGKCSHLWGLVIAMTLSSVMATMHQELSWGPQKYRYSQSQQRGRLTSLRSNSSHMSEANTSIVKTLTKRTTESTNESTVKYTQVLECLDFLWVMVTKTRLLPRKPSNVITVTMT